MGVGVRPPSQVHAESDSSALTLESGDESVAAPTPKGSVNTTGTDGATEYGEDEDVEVAVSPGTCRARFCFVFFLS